MNVSVKGLHTSDRSAWEVLYKGYAEFYNMPMTDETLNTVWQWIFDPNNRFFALIAKDEWDNGVGLMHYRGMPSPLRGAEVGFLDDLFVDPDCRSRGVAEQMFARLQQEAQAQNWPFVRWITAENNYRARAVYDRIADKTLWQTYQLNTDC